MSPPQQTLTQLEGDDWGAPTATSSLIETCHALRHKRLVDFTVEDLRIMIGQSISLAHLLPLALIELQRDPLAEGDYFPGDLLAVCLRADRAFLGAHVEMRDALVAAYEKARATLLAQGEPTKVLDDATQGLR